MQLEPRDIGVLIRAEAENLAHLAATGRPKDDLDRMQKSVAKLNLLLEALEAVSTKR